MNEAPSIYLFHGKGGRPGGSVSLIEAALAPMFPRARFVRPALLHGDPSILAQDSLAALPQLNLPQGATIIGVSLGGLVAARLQETSRPDLTVICVSSPTWADDVRIQSLMPRRVSFYSSNDDVIQGRTAEWSSLAEAYDIPSLSHDTDRHVPLLSRLIAASINKEAIQPLLP